MKHSIMLALCLLVTALAFSQKKYYTKSGQINFNAGTSVEDIDANNGAAVSVFDAATGQMEFAVLIKGFEFKKALMQEHFNENYMESDKFPKAIFKGKIVNIDKVNFQQNGTYPVTVKGQLDMHGVKKDVETTGTMKVNGEAIGSNAGFTVLLADYNIAIPSLVKDKVSKSVTIKINCNYNPLAK